MNYNDFKQELEQKVTERLQRDYGDAYAKASKTQKVNRELDSLIIVIHGRTLFPTIYSENLYERFKKISDITIQKGLPEDPMDVVLDEVYETIRESVDKTPEVLKSENIRLEKMPDNVVLQLVNTEQNQAMLENVPHREFEDLSIIYRWTVGFTNDGIYSTIVTNEMAEKVGLDEEELYQLAKDNTGRLLPAQVMSMSDVVVEMMVQEMMNSMPQELLEQFGDKSMDDIEEHIREKTMEEIAQDGPCPMYVIRNTERSFGAVQMLFHENLDKVSELSHDDLYILPSSVHEVISIPVMGCDAQELADMVVSVNSEEVRLEERLSNQVYYYDSREKKLSLATDTPNKKIDFSDTVYAENSVNLERAR